jgi:hypothetical protein
MIDPIKKVHMVASTEIINPSDIMPSLHEEVNEMGAYETSGLKVGLYKLKEWKMN